MTKDQVEKLNAIFGQVSSAQTALVLLSEELSAADFKALDKASSMLVEAEIEILCRLTKFKRVLTEKPPFPVGRCKHCGKEVSDPVADGWSIFFCSYKCYASN